MSPDSAAARAVGSDSLLRFLPLAIRTPEQPFRAIAVGWLTAFPASILFAILGRSFWLLVFVSILRAGTGILDGMLNVVPGARVGHIGLYRDPKTLQAVEYYFKMPQNMEERDVVVVDPMLATGNSAIAAVDRLKKLNPKSIKFVCLLTCPEGVSAMHKAHPDVPVYTAAIDRQLDDHGYIRPGLGDAGDRMFGTK